MFINEKLVFQLKHNTVSIASFTEADINSWDQDPEIIL